MMTDLVPFEYSGHQVRTINRDGEPGFVALDVCTVLDIKDVRQAVERLDQADRYQAPIRSGSQNRQMWIVNESGLYDLIIRSDKPQARPFRRWVTSEVLPAIRKTGRYGAPVLPDMTTPEGQLAVLDRWRAAVATTVQQARELEHTKAQVVELEPRAKSWDTLADTGADYSVREAAYILNRDPAIDTGQKRLFALLREWRLIGPDDRPYSNHAAHITLRPRTRTDRHTQEEVPARPQVRITVAGLNYLHRKLGGTAPLSVA